LQHTVLEYEGTVKSDRGLRALLLSIAQLFSCSNAFLIFYLQDQLCAINNYNEYQKKKATLQECVVVVYVFSNVSELVCSSCSAIKMQRMPSWQSEWKSHPSAAISCLCSCTALWIFIFLLGLL